MFSFVESEFDKRRKSMEADGWKCLGMEKLTRTSFSKDAKFEEEAHQTEEEIKSRYLESIQKNDPASAFEVMLLLDENAQRIRDLKTILSESEYQDMLMKLRDEDKGYYVFARRIEK